MNERDVRAVENMARMGMSFDELRKAFPVFSIEEVERIYMQISNIGSEVSRTINWKNKGNEKRKLGFCDKAVEFLESSMEDPKNKHRVNELRFCVEELVDYFKGDNEYGTTDEMLHKYYDAFI